MPNPFFDSSWAYAAVNAIHNNLQFGKDFIFSIGPYGALYAKIYDPILDKYFIIFGLFLSLAYTICILILKEKKSPSYWILLLLIPLLGNENSDSIYLFLPALIVFSFYKSIAILLKVNYFHCLISIFSLGLLSLSKGTFFYLSLYAILLLVLLCIYKKKYFLILLSLSVYTLSIIILWLIAGQKINNLFNYFIILSSISFGYTEAMSNYVNIFNDFLFIIVIVLYIYIIYKESVLPKIDKYLLISFISGFLFILFKDGFVRDDIGHISIAYISLILLSLILPFIFKFKSFNILFFSFTFIALLLFNFIYNSIIMDRHSFLNYFDSVKYLYIRISDPNYLNVEFNKHKEYIIFQNNLPNLSGTTDIYCNNQNNLIVSSNNWNPRPMFLSANAFNNKLITENLNHITNQNIAPDNIFFKLETIGGRFPTMDDGISLAALLYNYNYINTYNNYLILKNNKKYLFNNYSSKTIFSKNVNFNEVIDISRFNHPLFMKIDINPSFVGKLLNIVYKSSPIFLQVDLENGNSSYYRIYPAATRSGFIISPLIIDTNQFKQLFFNKNSLGALYPYKIKSFKVINEIPFMKQFFLSKFVSSLWKDYYNISLYKL
jgi:hypothetical protein